MGELLGADADVLERVSQSLSLAARDVQNIRALAQRALAELQAGWIGPDLGALSHRWEQQASPRLADVSASLDCCAAELGAQLAAQRAASGEGGAGPGSLLVGMALLGPLGPLMSLPTTPSPPAIGSPAANATWWRSLSAQQHQWVIEQHPAWIGNRDGVAFAARDAANRALLGVDRSRLEAEQARLERAVAGSWSGGDFTNDDAALVHVREKLASLDAIESTLGRMGERQLILLDLSAQRAQAAIARGNVDTADNVVVLVPGMSASVSGGMAEGDQTMEQLQRRAELESKRAHTNQTAATLTWIGYQAPEMGWGLLGANSVVDDRAARSGAARLVPFLQGIGSARDDDAHLTLLGHSYGSTAAGLALRQETGVDDAVFFGSPGIGTSHLDDLRLAPGHTYYVEARQDAVGDLGHFGLDLSHMSGIEHASAKASTVVDPLTGEIRHFKEVTGHSSYLTNESTSQYNMSVVAAGLPDRRVRGRGAGFGDILSWPIPGTYP